MVINALQIGFGQGQLLSTCSSWESGPSHIHCPHTILNTPKVASSLSPVQQPQPDRQGSL